MFKVICLSNLGFVKCDFLLWNDVKFFFGELQTPDRTRILIAGFSSDFSLVFSGMFRTSAIMVNCWFGACCLDSWDPLKGIDCLRATLLIPNHRAPNQHPKPLADKSVVSDGANHKDSKKSNDRSKNVSCHPGGDEPASGVGLVDPELLDSSTKNWSNTAKP